ncbi:MAG: hypothetical protein ACI9OJ_003413, partial [Myxococcota bacterium]
TPKPAVESAQPKPLAQWREGPPPAEPSSLAWLWSPPTFGVLAIIIGIVALLVLRSPASGEEDGAARTAGSVRLSVYHNHGGKLSEVVAGTKLRGGDSVRFAIGLTVPAHVVVFGAEENGRLFPAWPASGISEPLPQASRTELGGSVTLRDSVGAETFYVVACEEPFTLLKLSQLSQGRLDMPDGCVANSLPIVKGTRR